MADKSEDTKSANQANTNPNPNLSTSGLDTQGQMRIGDRITIAVRGQSIVLRNGNSGREVEVTEHDLEHVLVDNFFVDHAGENDQDQDGKKGK